VRQSILIAVVVERNDLLVEQFVERIGVRSVVVMNFEILRRIASFSLFKS
jgi:hypothetical protein